MNAFIVYFETMNGNYTNSRSIQCDTVPELLYQLREYEKEKGQNLIIITIQNAKPQ